MISDDAHLEQVPHVMYRMYDDERRLLYIGISANFGKRLDKHLRDKPWFSRIAYISVSHYATRTACLQAERRAIVTEKPLHNLAHSGQPGDPFAGVGRDVIRFEDIRPTGIPAPDGRPDDYQRYSLGGNVVSAANGRPLRPIPQLRLGDRVLHDAFGIGTVTALRGSGDSSQAEVVFNSPANHKWLLLRYAPIEKVI